MSQTRDQETYERLNALLEMIEEGDTPAGQLPSDEYIKELRRGRGHGFGQRVAEAAREGTPASDIDLPGKRRGQ
jgi:hypothetical protein